MFGEVAGRYDFLNHLLSMNVDRYWRWQVVRKAPPAGSGPVLDVCTGTGDLAIAYSRLLGPHRRASYRCDSGSMAASDITAGRDPISVVATDFCREMLQLGRRKGRRVGAGNGLVFIEADTLSLPFPSDHFSLVSVAFGLRNVADVDRGLEEMTRVCAKGGKVVVLEFSLPTRQPLQAVYRWYLGTVLPRVGQLVSGSRSNAYNYLSESVDAFPFGEALAERMRAVGLVEVSVHPLSWGIATLYVGLKNCD
jgi:demethylmenaquinone methyltransferase/2-methoxy-6-polyprenyl-1,4-benzoquinol methylase